MKQYSPNSNIIITTYYLYIQQEIVQRSKSTKLIIQHYSKTKYKMHELAQSKYDNAF